MRNWNYHDNRQPSHNVVYCEDAVQSDIDHWCFWFGSKWFLGLLLTFVDPMAGVELPPVIPPVPMTLDEIKKEMVKRYPYLATSEG